MGVRVAMSEAAWVRFFWGSCCCGVKLGGAEGFLGRCCRRVKLAWARFFGAGVAVGEAGLGGGFLAGAGPGLTGAVLARLWIDGLGSGRRYWQGWISATARRPLWTCVAVGACVRGPCAGAGERDKRESEASSGGPRSEIAGRLLLGQGRSDQRRSGRLRTGQLRTGQLIKRSAKCESADKAFSETPAG